MTILRMTEEEYADHTRGATTSDAESSRTAASDPANPRLVQDRLFDLRDYFAGQALAAMVEAIALGSGNQFDRPRARTAAIAAYEFADAMLAERDKGKA